VSLDLESFREALQTERAQLLSAAESVNHEGSLMEETGDLAIGAGDHIADSATETYMRELDGGLEENVGHLLQAVDAALVRIDDGTYGTCEVCGRDIGEERLRAVPYATLCIEHKRAQEGR
jgi:RNA polymerase-binding protein DksA